MGGVRQHLTGTATGVVMSTCGTTSVYDIVVMLQIVTHTSDVLSTPHLQQTQVLQPIQLLQPA
jgi:hypothetical protein